MSEAKWTPGPWRINTAPTGKHEIVADGEPMVVCRISERIYQTAASANARLIAEAPGLYEIGAVILAEVKDGNYRISEQVVERLRVHLAKARGEQQ